MGFQVNMEFDDGVLAALRKTPEEFGKEIRFLAAAKWYEMGEVSQESAAGIAGMSRLDFLLAISRIGVTPFQYSAKDVLDEVEDVR